MSRPVLVVAAIVFLAATGVFSALWVEERSDLRTTTGQIETVDAETRAINEKVTGAELQANAAVKQKKTIDERQPANAARDAHEQACAEVAHRLARALRENDAATAGAARGQLPASCS